MSITKSLRFVTGALLTGALVFSPEAAASADQVRDAQWVLNELNMEDVWKITKGEGVTVAVIDEGFDRGHPDLKKNVISLKDFSNGAPLSDEERHHGTHMASLIAGHGHGVGNSEGVIGLAPEAELILVRRGEKNGNELSESIEYAVDQGAKIINISLGGPSWRREEAEAVEYALSKGVLIVAPSGNSGNSSKEYPGAYPGVLAVGGVDKSGEVWEWANYGPHVLLSAPAVENVSAGGNNSPYSKTSGTSDSSAYVSATAALVWSEHPDLSPGQVVNRLTETAGLPDSAKGISLPDEKYGYGYIRPLNALTEDIPAGSKYGPLTVPDSLQSPSPEPAGGSDSEDKVNNTLKRIMVFLVAPVLLLLVIGLVIFAVVRSSRRKKRSAPVGVGWGEGPQAQQPPYGQPMPPGNAGGFPPQQQGPNQNQPSGPWGP
ncbi:S8 family serine peptidase [Streptomyces thermolineatus]|uniref:S8 family serine peptidase n=1 Tax=Streptomyces thermolineatus TaxID=44033 RepID=UPI003850455F